MAAGDILLDASGNRILDDSGNTFLSDGSGDGCCCCELPSDCLLDPQPDIAIGCQPGCIPATVSVVISGATAVCTGGQKVTSGAIDGSYCLGFDGVDRWEHHDAGTVWTGLGYTSNTCTTTNGDTIEFKNFYLHVLANGVVVAAVDVWVNGALQGTTEPFLTDPPTGGWCPGGSSESNTSTLYFSGGTATVSPCCG